jgi:hypothetical protein
VARAGPAVASWQAPPLQETPGCRILPPASSRPGRRRAIPHTGSTYAASCIRDSSARADKIPMCMAAKMQCLQTGVHVGPYSGRHFAAMTKI